MLLTDVPFCVFVCIFGCSSSGLPDNAKNRLISFLEPGTAPRKVQVRPLSSSTMVIQWDEPETPNGQVTVGAFFRNNLSPRFPLDFRNVIANERAICPSIGIQGVLHDGLESAHGIVAVPDGGQQPIDNHLGADAAHDLYHKGPGAHERRPWA